MAAKTAVVIVNLGTPDTLSTGAVRRYLKEFLGDPRVVDAPRWLWFWVLHCLILPFRPRKALAKYRLIWQEDSPIRTITQQQAEALAKRFPVKVAYGMTYGEPSLASVLDELQQAGTERILILPLYPQYSATTNGAVADVVAKWVMKQREVPEILQIKDYWQEPLWVQAIADSVREYRRQYGGDGTKLLMSFHGIPQEYEDKGDRYGERCRLSAQAIAQALGLKEGEWAYAFQSRFGPKQWLPPYTDEVIASWAKAGEKRIQVICPGFAADCLETLEEISVDNRELFLAHGGEQLDYIPALNADAAHIDALAAVCEPYLRAWEPSRSDAAKEERG